MSATFPASSAARGLSSSEAAARLRQFGPNRLVTQDRLSRVRQALAPFLDPMALMLVLASGIYLALGERRSALVMAVALIPVVGVDVLLEARSRAALRKLAQSVAPKTRVLRDGAEVDVDTAVLVPGDLLVLAEGEFLHADGVVRGAANLAIDESSLTGEADPQVKRAFDANGDDAPADARFYAGSTVLAGAGLGEVLATGARTRFADIARLVSETSDGQTPLQRRVGALVKKLAVAAGIVAIAILVLARLRGLPWGEALMAGVGVAMSAAPEEFPLVFTLYLSLGAWRLSRVGVLVRRLASVETLGSTTVICTDKTGTLTRGQ
ncbi:MAG: HAD-IC family P-type ATPase, partial [Pseudomonadota bacterium]